MLPTAQPSANSGGQVGLGDHEQNPCYENLLHDYSQLQERMQRRTLALASAAHELKTPLSILSGYLEILLNGKLGTLNDRQSQVLKAMQGSSVRLQQFIRDFLTYSALETNTPAVELEPGDLSACLRELYEIWLPRFQDKEIAFYFLAPEKTVPSFRFDYHKIQRVVSHLLENAFSYVPTKATVWMSIEPYLWDRRVHQHGEIVGERRRVSVTGPNAARINVCDTGPGIAPEFHQEIFEDFVSLRRSPDTQGSGLGLAIARRLMLAQQGKIWVESQVERGAKFSLLLPLNPSELG
jgi:signal transduction histidine kinase